MKLFIKRVLVASFAMLAIGFTNCTVEGGGGDSPEPTTDVGAALDTGVSPDDAGPASDTATPDVTAPVDTVAPQDTAAPPDTAAPEDATPPQDTAVAEDILPEDDVVPASDATPDPVGLCTNEADQAIVDSQDDEFDIEQISTDCVIANILGDPDGSKAKKCIQDATDLSDQCTECFGEVALCGKDKCLGSCAINPDGQDCTDCIAANCLPAFEECSGLSTEK